MSFFRLVSPGLRAGLVVAAGSALFSVPFALSAVTRYSAGPATPSFLQ